MTLRCGRRVQGERAADLCAHLGWGEHLRWREGSAHADPVTYWLFADGRVAPAQRPNGRFVHAMLQARAGQHEAARAGLQALLQAHENGPALSFGVVEETRRELAALAR